MRIRRLPLIALSLSLHTLVSCETQPVDDLVGHLALGAHREPDKIEPGAVGRRCMAATLSERLL